MSNSPRKIKLRKLLSVKPFRENPAGGYCGPASLKMILNYYGVDKDEEELAVLCGRDPKLGVGHEGIRRVAEEFGFKVEIKNFATFDDIRTWLKKGVPLIVDWITRGRSDSPESEVADGHYSVVVGLDKGFIYLQDPEIGRLRKIKRNDFMRVWFDFKGKFIKSPEDLVIRPIIAIYR